MEPFILAGKGVIPGTYGDIEMVDVAPTLAVLLGTNIPATNQGHPLVAMLDISLTQVDEINQALKSQQSQLAVAYQEAIGRKVTVEQSSDIVTSTQTGMENARKSLLASQQVPRGIIAIVILFFLLTLTAWYARPYYRWMLIGVVGYLLVFNIKYILIDHKTYSLSSVIDATNLISSTAFTTLIALFVGWLIFILGTNIYKLKPYKTTQYTVKFILTTFSILAIPVLVHFAMDGATVTWALPDFLISFLGLLFLIQLLMVAVIGLFLTAISPLLSIFAHGK
jgi:hypothetical protein